MWVQAKTRHKTLDFKQKMQVLTKVNYIKVYTVENETIWHEKVCYLTIVCVCLIAASVCVRVQSSVDQGN